MDNNNFWRIFSRLEIPNKDSYTKEIFEGVFPKDQFLKGNFEKKTYMCLVNEQDSRFPGSHWLMVYQKKKNIYFIDSLGRDFTHYDFKFKRPFYQVSRRLQCLDSKLCGTYLVFFGCKLERGLDLDSTIDYFTWDCRLRNEFMDDYQGKTTNSENNTRKFSSTMSSSTITSRKKI